MILTFAQYRILLATQNCMTYSQIEHYIDFDHMLISLCFRELLTAGLVTISNNKGIGQPCCKLTDAGEKCIEEYERANPELTIRPRRELNLAY